ncbi:MAG TPA: Uma2 family endonuclease [Pirellulales bacterium]|nr:Uma2 family endonuclease [Pirellulales bacterium]
MSTIARLSLEQYERMIEAGVFDSTKPEHIELIHGELREMTPMGSAHQLALNVLDNDWTRKLSMPEGVWVQTQAPITLSNQRSMPEPDMVWIAKQDLSKPRPDAADVFLLIEISESSLVYDRGEKADLYAAAGIKDYWIVNLPDKCVEVRREPRDGRYQSVESFSRGAEIAPLAFPKLALPVALLFGEK